MKISTAIRKASKRLPQVYGVWYNQKSYFDSSYARLQRRRDIVFNALIMINAADHCDIEQAVYDGGYYQNIDDLLYSAVWNLGVNLD